MPRGFGIFFFGGRGHNEQTKHHLLVRRTMRFPCFPGFILNEQERDSEIFEDEEKIK
jgi:hypothetical protein